MKVKILTIFPELFPGFLGASLTGKALESISKEINTLINSAVQSILLDKDSIENLLKNLSKNIANLDS